jgi:EpsI family protein
MTSQRLSRRLWILALLLLPAAALSTILEAREPSDTERGGEAAMVLPLELGGWRGRDVPLTDRTIELLGTDRVLFREYRAREGARALVCWVRSRERIARVHPPEVCYRGWGYEIVRKIEAPVEGPDGTFEANLLRLEKPGRTLLSLYWYRVDGRPTKSFLGQQLRLALPGNRDGAGDLVRLSTRLAGDEDPSEAVARLLELARHVACTLDGDVEKSRHASPR